MKDSKEIFKKNLIGFIIGIIAGGSISVIAATYFPSNEVKYDNSVSGLQSTNVQGAIDELYTVCTYEPTGGEQILENVDIVTSGDGLYKDEYEDRNFYRGVNVNNYITFSGETWRILSIEGDGRIKIVRNAIIGDRAWDNSAYGINRWARPATLNTYLNETYKNTLTDKDKIAPSTWNIGSVDSNDKNLSSSIAAEKSSTWSGDIALITATEYTRSNSNTSGCGNVDQICGSVYCDNTTWLYLNEFWWILTPVFDSADSVFMADRTGGGQLTESESYYSFGIRPTLYLKSDIKITRGDGSQSNPYIIS